MNRTAVASLLTAAALAIPLGAWYVAGARDAAREAKAVEDSPLRQAREAAAGLAEKLAARLESLRETESRRPFYHYQNLYNDPEGAAEGQFVVPSPLSDGPADPLVRAHFQVDASGRLSLPTLNPDVPERNRPDTLTTNTRIFQELLPNGMDFVKAMRGAYASTTIVKVPKPPAANPPLVTVSAVPNAPPADAPPPKPVAQPEPVGGKSSPAIAQGPVVASSSRDPAVPQSKVTSSKQQDAQLQRMDQQSWDNMQSANMLWRELRGRGGNKQQVMDSQPAAPQSGQQERSSGPPQQGPVQQASGGAHIAAPSPASSSSAVKPSVQTAQPPPSLPPAAGQAGESEITIRVEPLVWRTVPVAGLQALAALREVTTPVGTLVQGFEISRASVEEWLKGPSLPARFLAGAPARDGEARVPIEGAAWRVAVDPADAVSLALDRARRIRTGFRRNFLFGSAGAVLAGILVVGLVWQSERLARQRSRFAASAAHELRTPLAGLRMYGEMLAEGLGDPAKSKDYARRVADEAERLGRVVSNVLGFSRLERGALAVRPEPGDLGAAVREAVERQRPALESLGAAVDLAVADGLPAARFDRDAVAQILQNLLDNAEKYARGATDRLIRIEVRCPGSRVPSPESRVPSPESRVPGSGTEDPKRATPDPGPGTSDLGRGTRDLPCVELVVSDRGPGVSADARGRLFQPFARGGGADAPAGLGLGLAIARALARAMGGDLVHVAAERGGATFIVSLPV